jgi:hypothetical protein
MKIEKLLKMYGIEILRERGTKKWRLSVEIIASKDLDNRWVRYIHSKKRATNVEAHRCLIEDLYKDIILGCQEAIRRFERAT